ncbi:MAG: helix-turn-helix domain-containing protein [Oscillospiraceae bacterium]
MLLPRMSQVVAPAFCVPLCCRRAAAGGTGAFRAPKSGSRRSAAQEYDLRKFCERVKALREATGLTRNEFAESIGEYPGTYSAWENNSLAGAATLPKLALTLGTTMDYLCGLTDDLYRRETSGGLAWISPRRNGCRLTRRTGRRRVRWSRSATRPASAAAATS